VKFGLMGGLGISWKGKTREEASTSWRGELFKCTQPKSMLEMEISLVGDGNYSRAILVSGSTQRWRREKVHRTLARLGKGIEKEDEEEEERTNLRKILKVYLLLWE
jgi:hypothetical protein